ncbi:PaaX family transcriptional regulator [Actinomadura sp. WMMB 499]|nr:PaaX family transcriptional regulator [Actinomadura sp. WMMB 499]
MLTYLGNYVLGRDIAVFSGSFIDTFARLGVGEHAVRSTLTRMVGRGLLARHRDGRRMHFGLTARSAEILHDGEERVWRRGVVTDWDGTWTVLAFSMPDSWQRARHDLRARLAWAGFGSLGNGTWIAPSRRDVRAIVGELGGLEGRLKVFSGPAEEPTDVPAMLREAFDLDAVANGYRAFLDRWDRPGPLPDAPDDLARYLWMMTEWLQLVRDDPRLPVEHLPDGWPAVRAQQVLLELGDRYQREARRLADAAIESIPVPPPAAPDAAEAG